MKAISLLGCLFLLALAFAGCTGNTDDNNNETNLTGVWHRVSTETMHGDSETELDYMVLNDDSTASLHFRNPDLGNLICYDALYTSGDGIIFLTVYGLFEGTLMAQYEMTTANAMHFSTLAGDTADFERVTALPDQYACGTLNVLNTYTGLPAPSSGSGLAYDGTLWYTRSDAPHDLQPISTGGTAGAPVAALTYPYVQACQGNDFWCLAPSGDAAQLRRADNTLLDSVDTEADLGAGINAETMAYDASAGELWIHGTTSGVYRMLRVHSSAEPDVLISATTLDVRIQALAWYDGNLWALMHTEPNVLVEFDPATLTALQTYSLPLPNVDWRGLTFVGTSLYLIGEEAGAGVLLQTTLQP